jgi:hypothetical protein
MKEAFDLGDFMIIDPETGSISIMDGVSVILPELEDTSQ